MARALAAFTVRHGTLRLRVRLLATERQVDAEYRETARPRRDGKLVPAFFSPAVAPTARHVGTVVLPAEGRLEELIPHEVSHAAVHHFCGVHIAADEDFATAVGLLTARIHARIRRLEVSR